MGTWRVEESSDSGKEYLRFHKRTGSDFLIRKRKICCIWDRTALSESHRISAKTKSHGFAEWFSSGALLLHSIQGFGRTYPPLQSMDKILTNWLSLFFKSLYKITALYFQYHLNCRAVIFSSLICFQIFYMTAIEGWGSHSFILFKYFTKVSRFAVTQQKGNIRYVHFCRYHIIFRCLNFAKMDIIYHTDMIILFKNTAQIPTTDSGLLWKIWQGYFIIDMFFYILHHPAHMGVF